MDNREVRRPVFRTGESCFQPGIYSSNDCDYEIMMLQGESFPECPLHSKHVDWTFVRKEAS